MFRITRTGLAGLALALPFASASASVVPQATNSEIRVSPSISDAGPFSGEIEYGFDTALNRTQARFKASLGSGNVLFRVFVAAPPVHTLIAAYEFRGRVPADYPDTVRLTLISDEYTQASDHFLLRGATPILVASLGDTVISYPLGIAQRVEEWVVPNTPSVVTRSSGDNGSARYLPQQLPHVIHIERTATASIPICDFLALVNTRNVRGTVAGLEFDLNDGVVSGLRRFAAQMNHGAGVSGDINCR
jgi:hypothetical protein